MKIFLSLLCIIVGIVCVIMLIALYKTRTITDAKLRSVTKLLFISTQISALFLIFVSYAIAVYSTVKLGQVYTMSELSEPLIKTILGVSFLKVLENIFEHNDNAFFGKSKKGDLKDD